MDSLFLSWGGHLDDGLNGDQVGLETVCSDNMAYDGCLADKKLHFVDVQLDMILLELLKYSDQVSVMVHSGLNVGDAAARN